MDAGRSSGRRGKGGTGRGGSRLGMKTAFSPTPPAHLASSFSPPPPSFLSAPPALPSCSLTPAPPTSSPAPAPAAPSSSPTARTSSPPQGAGVTQRPAQGVGLGAMPPNFPSGQGNQQAPNLWVYPPGGFLNMIRQNHPPQPQQHGENFHLVGQSMSFNPMFPPSPSVYGTPTPEATKQGTSTNIDESANIDANRAAKMNNKRYWTHEEEEKLASAWLNASKDPIHGNYKKGDTFWKEVTAEFNRKGNGKRTRELNQLKIHWSRLKSSIGDFNDYWTKVTWMHTSGYSNDMLEEEAQKMYANRFGKRFQLVHWWKILKDEPKWCALFEKEKDKAEVVDIPEEQMRPIGREAAKAECSGKRKKAKGVEVFVGLGDTIEKIAKVQQDRNVELAKVTEAQLLISYTQLKAAQEEKEAKMLQVYNTLLSKDTSNMSEGEKGNHERAIHKIEEKLFGD